ncbi:dihydrofolate reductase [Catellatospora sp. NPDC049133]|jgi:dihydrofolate reductase|uniref:dihydrofolate reductase n=1 Tax=Catellatospora sp. NPDC049133 TaxID=3155499 RepID=UPI0033D63606
MTVSLIVAADVNDVIGLEGDLPWTLPADLRRFKRLTTGHVVVMGRRTHESILARLGRPLPERFSVVVSRRARGTGDSNVLFQADLPSALTVARGIEAFADRDEVFIIGGAQIYAQTLDQVDRVYLTRVHKEVAGDAVMPADWLKPFTLVEEEAHPDDGYSFLTYERS